MERAPHRPHRALSSALILASLFVGACDDAKTTTHTPTPDAVEDTATPPPPPSRALGLNDVSILLPLPTAGAAPLVPMGDLVPPGLFASLVTDSQEVFTDYARFHVVAVRFDLCDRVVPGPCPPGSDGSLRVVLQPLLDGFGAEDVALHAFFPIPNDELAELVGALRDLAELAEIPTDTPLGVNPALAADPPVTAYRDGLGALVARYARADHLMRLTFFAQFSLRSALVWLFRGVVKVGDRLVPIDIPGIDAPQQDVLLVGRLSYEVDPVVDAPAGFLLAVDEWAFAAADPDSQRAALLALDGIDDPAVHTAETVQCASCHITSNVRPSRMEVAGLSPTGPWPLGDIDGRTRTLRAFGYFGTTPIASQRVVNESLLVLREIDGRFR